MKALVAGIGNIFMGDDGFGCEVAQRLGRCELPDSVDVVDFGIRGMDLGYALTDGYDLAVLADTMQRGNAPGTVYTIEPDFDNRREDGPAAGLVSPHAMDPKRVLDLIATIGARRPRVVLVGCEPDDLGGEAGHMGLSAAVAAAVDEAVAEIQALLDEWRSPQEPGAYRPYDTSQHGSHAAPGGLT
ncbi:hydrogenase maturation protease [Spectribacter hydrogenoxidans]|uniref:Hydrogenase maturation protease n=1 Tax=Spectribacter hydrogenoxidans TaxID=3075608 RepID=A0ABU3C3Z1_9GAMM|nr:hydrogenase maturation protease [Salinisphaera sp. W335]MDT0636281.1 hydrogenase maturation protease [Salinisphaera sp. W335]